MKTRDARVTVLDPSMGSANLGDEIIRQAVFEHLEKFTGAVSRVPTQHCPNREERARLSRSRVAVVGGTNLLSSNMPFYRQWRVGAPAIPLIRHKAILLGVGWWQYQRPPNRYSRAFIRHVLNPDYLHSVRDDYTLRRLQDLGFMVINTGCPTLWGLRDNRVPRERSSDTCLVTVTDYNKRPGVDRRMIENLCDIYPRVIAWPQSPRDIDYLRVLGVSVEVLAPTLGALDALLERESPDYVGTRLHGGVRAMQAGCFAQIVAVDNRAIEMGRDFGLPVIRRDAVLRLRESDLRRKGQICIPDAAVADWKAKFKEQLGDSPSISREAPSSSR
jgi:polysaccharide pyruvyl transferase WcaK-like protein